MACIYNLAFEISNQRFLRGPKHTTRSSQLILVLQNAASGGLSVTGIHGVLALLAVVAVLEGDTRSRAYKRRDDTVMGIAMSFVTTAHHIMVAVVIVQHGEPEDAVKVSIVIFSQTMCMELVLAATRRIHVRVRIHTNIQKQNVDNRIRIFFL